MSEDNILSMLRQLAEEREENERAEANPRIGTEEEQAALALDILATERAWRVEDRRALALPRTADHEPWNEVVARRLAELAPLTVVRIWLLHRRSRRTLAVATSAFERLPDVALVLGELRESLVHEVVRDALSAARVDATSVLRELLVDDAPRALAEAALLVAGAHARRTPALIAVIVRRVRFDRAQRRSDAHTGLRVATSRGVMEEALALAACPALAATVKLELEESLRLEPCANILVACAGEAAVGYLKRMQGRPGWGGVLGPPPRATDPLFDLLSPIADVRRAALRDIAPRPERVQAFLLAAEFEQYTTRYIHRAGDSPLDAAEWLALLAEAAGRPLPSDSLLARARGDVAEVVAGARSRSLLAELVDSGAARHHWPTPQELTPALEALLAQGVEACAANIATRPPTSEDLEALDREEAQLLSASGSTTGPLTRRS